MINVCFPQDCESICKHETIKWECDCMVLESPHARTYRKGKNGSDLAHCKAEDRDCIKYTQAKYDEHAGKT